ALIQAKEAAQHRLEVELGAPYAHREATIDGRQVDRGAIPLAEREIGEIGGQQAGARMIVELAGDPGAATGQRNILKMSHVAIGPDDDGEQTRRAGRLGYAKVAQVERRSFEIDTHMKGAVGRWLGDKLHLTIQEFGRVETHIGQIS